MTGTVTKKVSVAGVGNLARRLMAIERARALGRKPMDIQTQSLELAARHWQGERVRSE